MELAVDGSGHGLHGRRALVTGAASGIGRATAGMLARLGCDVALADLDAEGLKRVRTELSPAGRHIAFPADLSSPEAAEQLVEDVKGRLGGVDILVNAAATLKRMSVADIELAAMERMIAVNMVAPLFLARAAAGHMKTAGRGRMIFFSSQSAFTGGYIGATVYAMTKAAILAMVKSLARDLAPWNICVNAVAPGGIDTPMLRTGATEAALEQFRQTIPMGRFGTAGEVAATCAFLASDWAAYVTGHTLDVNGGQLMR